MKQAGGGAARSAGVLTRPAAHRRAEGMLLIASGIDHDPLPEDPRGGTHVYRPGEKITRLTGQNIRDAASLGFKVLQIAAGDHFNRDIGPDGRGDWSRLDEDLRILADHDMEALLVAGFYWKPPWMRDDPRAVALRCLEHDEPIPVLSLWSPFTLEWIDRCTRALAEHLRGSPARIRGISVMINGDFGEAIYPAGMLNVGGEAGGGGDGNGDGVLDPGVHTHGDFWCNDRFARADYLRFREMGCGPRPAGARRPEADDPDLFPAPPDDGRPLEPWLNFLRWHQDSMTRFASKVVGINRKWFPEQELVIWLGGAVEPHAHGQDNTGLPKAMKAHRATIRSTAAASQLLHRRLIEPDKPLGWAFCRNYPILKRVTTACRFYGVPSWFEPPYPPGLEGPEIAVRVFEALSCGVGGYFEWTRTLQRQRETYAALLDSLVHERPRVDVAVYFPLIRHRSMPGSLLPRGYWDGAARLRTVVDFDVVDDRLIRDGALAGYGILVMPEADLLDAGVWDDVRAWVECGGTLIVQSDGPMRLVGESKRDEPSGLLPRPSLEEPVARGAHGRGSIIACVQDDGALPRFVTVLADLLATSDDDRLAAARTAAGWMNGDGRLFATVLEDRVLLANLSDEPIRRTSGGVDVEPGPHAITSVSPA